MLSKFTGPLLCTYNTTVDCGFSVYALQYNKQFDWKNQVNILSKKDKKFSYTPTLKIVHTKNFEIPPNFSNSHALSTVNARIHSPLRRNYKMRAKSESSPPIWKHCDADVRQTTCGLWLLETEAPPWNVTKVRNDSLCEPWWSWWYFANG